MKTIIKYIFILSTLASNFSCERKQTKIQIKESNSNFSIVDSNLLKEYDQREQNVLDFLKDRNLLFLNDTAKWYLYNIYCDTRVPRSLEKLTDTTYFSYLQLRPLYVTLKKDNKTLEIYYSFLLNKLERLESFPADSFGGKVIVDGIRFDIKTNKIIDFINGRGSYAELGNTSRFVTPVQADVAIFARRNKSKLNEWYRTALTQNQVLPK